MANATTLDSLTGGNPSSPLFVAVVDVALTDYVTGGVVVDDLLAANAAWKAKKLEASSIVSGFVALDPDAQGVTRVAEFLPDSRKIVLKKVAAGAIAQESNGAIGATVNAKLTLILA